MSLRKKIALILLGVGVIYAAADNTISRSSFSSWFEAWEVEDAQRSLAQVQAGLEEQEQSLVAKAKIWAHTEGLFHFLEEPEQEYSAFLERSALEASDVDVFYVLDGEGTVLWSRIVDPESGAPTRLRVLPSGSLHESHTLRSFKRDEPIKSGLMITDVEPLFVVSYPVPDARGEQLSADGPIPDSYFPRYGSIILGRFLGPELRGAVASRAHAEIEIYDRDTVELTDSEYQLTHLLTSMEEDLVYEVGEDGQLHTYAMLDDLRTGRPLILEAAIDREITRRGRGISNQLLLSTLASALVLVLVVYRLLARFVLEPLFTLTSKAVEIGRTDNTKIRVGMERDDEVGQLANEFDDMLEKLAQSRTQVVKTARLAGMSQIASGVLHNVGNVLNSVNVSATMVSRKTEKLPVGDLEMMTGVLREHQDDIGDFVTRDPKGKHLLPFLFEVTESLSSQRGSLLDELRSLNGGIEHIADLVRAQQSFAGTKGVFEFASLEEEVESAIRFCDQAMIDSGQFELVREFDELGDVKVDKHKLMEILVNLLQNARQALDEADRPDRRLTVRILRVGGDKARIEVEDSGAGIREEDLARIFQHGFTTKKEGHGFGLHVSANAATEMNASLQVHSDGPGCGATFYLDIPIERHELARAA